MLVNFQIKATGFDNQMRHIFVCRIHIDLFDPSFMFPNFRNVLFVRFCKWATVNFKVPSSDVEAIYKKYCKIFDATIRYNKKGKKII